MSNGASANGTAAPAVISANGLSKFYGTFAATKGVTFSVPRGQVCAFLGPNGAGKSTTMKMLTGYLAPSEGHAEIAGFNMETQRLEAAPKLGYLPENGPLYLEMTPASLLRFVGDARGMDRDFLESRLEYVAVRCSLKGVWRKPISKLSKGYRQRVGMAQALLHDPDVLILDEPTSGLDPNQTHDVRDLITSLAGSKTILLSTHILTEVTAVCSRVVLVNEGKVVFDGPVSEMDTGKGMETRFRELTVGAR